MEFAEEPLEPFGEMLLEVSVPSDLGYKTPVVLRIIKQLQEHGCLPPGDNPRTELVLDEALTNAMLHGNKCDPHKEVAVRLFTDQQRWGVIVEDEGEGFGPEQLEQPSAVLLSKGRGVQLMDAYVDELRYNAMGNAVMLVRHCQAEIEGERPAPKAAVEEPVGGVEVRRDGEVAVVCIHERRVSQENIREVNRAITRAAGEAAALVLDMRDVGFITSVFIGTLVSRHKEFNQRRGYFVLTGLRPEVEEILASVALDKLLEIAEDLDQAVASVRSRLRQRS